ncbi:ABC transporter permease [Clostridium sp. SYSU_GA19001]|uniref:ABC transporter permease n=1 Tax=Clostridium caldaquaticum TaxID=2940653 RepID=UPI0020778C55|nr:ABC transporter permease [Clostridium caldaquaticum]MCM8711822.1 ABC transporter permease [Clostridium caldaquaticum]
MHKNKFVISLLAVISGLITGAFVMALTGYNPIKGYQSLLKGAGLIVTVKADATIFDIIFNKRFGDTLLNMTTLILTGLSVSFAFRTGLFNIGVAGQMLIGGFFGTLIGVKLSVPAFAHVPLAVVSSIIGGALWALIPGILKARYRIHEVVTSIMMNYISLWSVYYFVPVIVPGEFETESAMIKSTASLRTKWMTEFFHGSNINLGLFLAFAAVVIVWFILEKTVFGYELKAVGFNINASKYAGMKVNRNMVLSMMISGAFAGLAGATFYLGYAGNIKLGALPAQGYDGIAVALLGLNNPFGVVLSALLFGLMNAGSLFMNSSAGVPNELVSIIIAIIIYFAATSLMLENLMKRFTKIYNKKGGGK